MGSAISLAELEQARRRLGKMVALKQDADALDYLVSGLLGDIRDLAGATEVVEVPCQASGCSNVNLVSIKVGDMNTPEERFCVTCRAKMLEMPQPKPICGVVQ